MTEVTYNTSKLQYWPPLEMLQSPGSPILSFWVLALLYCQSTCSPGTLLLLLLQFEEEFVTQKTAQA